MKVTQENIENAFIKIAVDKYLQRIVSAMSGMLFPQAEKCRLNYWNRILRRLRLNNLNPAWDDFERYLHFIPSEKYPGISKNEFEAIGASFSGPSDLLTLEDEDLRILILQQAFIDYALQTTSAIKKLSKESAMRRRYFFWQWYGLLLTITGLKLDEVTFIHFARRFEIPKALLLTNSEIAELNQKSIGLINPIQKIIIDK